MVPIVTLETVTRDVEARIVSNDSWKRLVTPLAPDQFPPPNPGTPVATFPYQSTSEVFE